MSLNNQANVILLLLLALAFFVLACDRGMAPVPASGDPARFSAERAYSFIKEVSHFPHPVGSREHTVVRDYLLRELRGLGLEPEVQKETIIENQRRVVAVVENLHVVIHGIRSSRTVFLVAHYDSVPTSTGAADDGSGVAAILEAARALKQGSPLANDIEILFTDAEELGLLGAQAFVKKRIPPNKADIVFNFEARGGTGPALMFETGAADEGMIIGLRRSTAWPNATSISSEVYNRMPNDTDFTVFKRAGFRGLNFAFIDGFSHYHTMLDSSRYLDQRSLQQQGAYVLGLARYFGGRETDLDRDASSVNPTYFTVFGNRLIVWSARAQRIANCLAVALLLSACVVGLRKRRLSPSGILTGFAAVAVHITVAVLATSLIWRLVCFIRPEYREVTSQFFYGASSYLVGFAFVVLAVGRALYGVARARCNRQDLLVGALVWWGCGVIVAVSYVPDGAYLFAVPLLLNTIGLMFFLLNGQERDRYVLVLLPLAATTAFFIWVPLIHQLSVALTITALPLVTVSEVVFLSEFLPYLSERRGTAAVVFVSLLIAAVAVMAGLGAQRKDSAHATPDHVFYLLDTTAGKAAWISFDRRLDEWTSQFFKHQTSDGIVRSWFPGWPANVMVGDASPTNLQPPAVTIESDKKTPRGRLLSIRLDSVRQAASAYIRIDEGSAILSSRIGMSSYSPTIAKGHPWELFVYSIPRGGISLTLETEANRTLHGLVYDCSYELPKFPHIVVPARPAWLIPAPIPFSDATLVGHRIEL